MALEALQLSGWLDGEIPIDPAGTDHVSGQPAAYGASGMALALTPADTVGVFKNDMVDEVAGGPSVGDLPAAGNANATVLKGFNKVKMTAGRLKTGAVQTPFAFPPTNSPWARGNHIFVTATGFWDNAPENANDPPFGVVAKAPASAEDSLEAEMFSMAPFSSAVTT
jgi:hypothetical protein